MTHLSRVSVEWNFSRCAGEALKEVSGKMTFQRKGEWKGFRLNKPPWARMFSESFHSRDTPSDSCKNCPWGHAALWYLFNLVVSLNYHWLPLFCLTSFEFLVLVVAFDLRICLGAYFVFLFFFLPSELLAKYLIRALSVGLTKNVKPSNICWLVSPPQALFKIIIFFVL